MHATEKAPKSALFPCLNARSILANEPVGADIIRPPQSNDSPAGESSFMRRSAIHLIHQSMRSGSPAIGGRTFAALVRSVCAAGSVIGSAPSPVQSSIPEQAVQAAQPSVQAAQPSAQEPQPEHPLFSDVYLPPQETNATISARVTISKARNPLFMRITSFAIRRRRRKVHAVRLLVFAPTG